MYSPKQVQDFLNLPPSTLRHYAREYADYLSPSAKLRRRKYTDADLEVLQKIKDLSAEGKTIAEIGPLLAEMPIDHESIIDGDEAASPGSSSIISMEVLREFEKMRQRDDQIDGKLDQVDDKLDQIIANQQSLISENEHLRSELEAERERSLIDRILGRKPPE